MLKKFILVLAFIYTVLLLIGGSCGGVIPEPQPEATLGNVSNTSLSLTALVGASASSSFTFENTGDAALTYTASENANFLEITSSPSGTVQPGNTATVTLEATCTAQEVFNGTINLSSNGGNASVAVTLTCTPSSPPPANGYNIDVRFIGTSTTAVQKAAFEQAALRWESVIQSELEDEALSADTINFLRQSNVCDPDVPDIAGETIDDLVIFAKVGPIDGPDKTLAQAGPNLVHTNKNLTLAGCMIFDEEDIDLLVGSGSFTDVVTHEMGHVLGIGTFWDINFNFSFDGPCPGDGSVGFTGSNAVREFSGLRDPEDPINPPVETDFGQGTACGHWDEGFFDNELMTGLVESPGTPLPLSRLTIASLEDLGYEVDYSLASSYTIPSCSPTCTLIEPQAVDEAWEVLLRPLGRVTEQGDIERFDR